MTLTASDCYSFVEDPHHYMPVLKRKTIYCIVDGAVSAWLWFMASTSIFSVWTRIENMVNRNGPRQNRAEEYEM